MSIEFLSLLIAYCLLVFTMYRITMRHAKALDTLFDRIRKLEKK